MEQAIKLNPNRKIEYATTHGTFNRELYTKLSTIKANLHNADNDSEKNIEEIIDSLISMYITIDEVKNKADMLELVLEMTNHITGPLESGSCYAHD